MKRKAEEKEELTLLLLPYQGDSRSSCSPVELGVNLDKIDKKTSLVPLEAQFYELSAEKRHSNPTWAKNVMHIFLTGGKNVKKVKIPQTSFFT